MKYETSPGDHINGCCAEAVRLAKLHNEEVEFKFNDKRLVATPTTNPAVLAAFYMDECRREQEAYQASPEYKKSCEEMKRKDKEKKSKLQSALETAPREMTCSDLEAWADCVGKNTDPYGACTVRYAETWARLMEARMASGSALEDIAADSSHVADTEGITGFMYGCAVGILSKVWIHGERLRRWHNKTSQIGTEGDVANESGGVLNPALLTITTK